jgi:CheY-specific phosphatase CheX
MFTQFFGNYLLNQKIIDASQLMEALLIKNETRTKLGVLAINAGYMTASQVEKVHIMQAQKTMKIGDLAVAMGYLTQEQVTELLRAQTPGYLQLGQALVDKGFLTNIAFEHALNAYKVKYQISDEDFINGSNDTVHGMVQTLYNDKCPYDQELFTMFLVLLINNLVRFIGEDFTILNPETSIHPNSTLYMATQSITGDYENTIHMIADEATLISFSSRYAGELFESMDEYVSSSACDFINLNNGLFTVNASNEKGLELKLTPPTTMFGTDDLDTDNAFVLPIVYPFGTIRFVITPTCD